MKGMIKFQAVYQMANVLFFTHNQKEVRELVVKVLEARVKHVDSCCTARKEYNLNLLYRFFQAKKNFNSKSNIRASGALSASVDSLEPKN